MSGVKTEIGLSGWRKVVKICKSLEINGLKNCILGLIPAIRCNSSPVAGFVLLAQPAHCRSPSVLGTHSCPGCGVFASIPRNPALRDRVTSEYVVGWSLNSNQHFLMSKSLLNEPWKTALPLVVVEVDEMKFVEKTGMRQNTINIVTSYGVNPLIEIVPFPVVTNDVCFCR